MKGSCESVSHSQEISGAQPHCIERCVGVSIVVHRTPISQLEKALTCLFRSPEILRIFIVDNSPTPIIGEELRQRGLIDRENLVEYIRMDNRGFGAGHNEGMRHSKAIGAKFHLVMNADVCWDGDVVGKMVEFMIRRPEAGMASPRVMYPDGDLQYSCRLLPTPADLFLKRFVPSRLTRKRMRRYLLADADHHLEFNPPYLLGSFLFFRMDALVETGGFDERFFMYPEDIDITRRIHRFALTLFCPYVTIVHEHAAASRHNRKMLMIHLRNMIRYFNKWGWFFDRERREFNRRLLSSLPHACPPEKGRG